MHDLCRSHITLSSILLLLDDEEEEEEEEDDGDGDVVASDRPKEVRRWWSL